MKRERGMIKRKCLKCGKEFLAVSKYNRLCNMCNKDNERIKIKVG